METLSEWIQYFWAAINAQNEHRSYKSASDLVYDNSLVNLNLRYFYAYEIFIHWNILIRTHFQVD